MVWFNVFAVIAAVGVASVGGFALLTFIFEAKKPEKLPHRDEFDAS